MTRAQDRAEVSQASGGTDSRRPSVSVVMPTLCEAENLPHVLPRLPGWIDELIIVDGHSTDDTVDVARALYPDVQVVYQDRRGKGDALKCGIDAASADIVVTLDADGSTDPEEIPRFVEALEQGADLAKGSRFLLGGGSEDLTLLRRSGNRCLTAIVNVLFRTRYSDLCYGYNALWKHRAQQLNIDVDGFEIETLLTLRAVQARLNVVEVPSWEGRRIHGSSNLRSFRDGWRILKLIVRERMPQRSPSSLSGDHKRLKRMRALEVGAVAGTLRVLGPHKVAANLAASAVLVAGATALPLPDEPGRFQAHERPPAGLAQAATIADQPIRAGTDPATKPSPLRQSPQATAEGGGAEDLPVASSTPRTPKAVPTTSPLLSGAAAAPGGESPSVASGLAAAGEAPAADVAAQPVIAQSAATPGGGGSHPEAAGSPPGQGSTPHGPGDPPPDHGGTPPGRNNAPPDQGGTPPGQGDTQHGPGDTPPGHGGTPPGQGGTPPDQGGTPPGQGDTQHGPGDTPPGQGGTPPSQGGTPHSAGDTPPGQGGTPPGQGDTLDGPGGAPPTEAEN